MNPRDQLRGKLSFGQGLGQRGRGMSVTFEVPGQLPDRDTRPGGDIVKGPSGETALTVPERMEIEILAGRSGAKYSWKKVHPAPDSANNTDDADGGNTYDSFPAVEMNGDEDVPAGTVVEAFRSAVGPWLLFSNASGGGAMSLVHVTSRTPDAGGWPAYLYVNDGDGTWSTGPNIRMELTPNGGETFEVGDYWAQRNGTSEAPRTVTDGVTTKDSTTVTSATASFTADDVGGTISGTGIPGGATITVVGSSTSVTISAAATASGTGISLTITPPAYPLYFAPGNDYWIHDVCRDSKEECDRLSLPHPIHVDENVDCETGEPIEE